MDKITLLEDILKSNIKKVTNIKKKDKKYFYTIAKIHSPYILWIGCSDSRINPTKILDFPSEDIFTYRNIGNVINEKDLSIMTALKYAVNILKIKNIIVCGHYNCGAIKNIENFWDNNNLQLDVWYKNIFNNLQKHYKIINKNKDSNKNLVLSKLNLLEQTLNLSNTSIIQNIWKQKKQMFIYSFLYNINTGLLSPLGPEINSKESKIYFYRKTIEKIKIRFKI